MGRLKSGYNINPYCDLEKELYHLNNDYVKYKNKWFAIDGKQRHLFYKQSENVHDSRFIDKDISEIHELLQSDFNIINFHLKKITIDSDNKYKYYNPNLIRNKGIIKK